MNTGKKCVMKNGKLLVVCGTLLLLPSCTQWVKDLMGCNKNESCSMQHSVAGNSSAGSCHASNDPLVKQGEVLATMDGKPVLSTVSFEREFNQILEENPQLKAILPHVPGAKVELLNGLVNRFIIDEYVSRNNIDQTAAYQEELDRAICSQKQLLNAKYFGQMYTAQATDAEAQDFYNKNKDTQAEFLLSRGGTQAAGVSFEKEDAAKAFLAKAQTQGFDAAAQEANLSDKVRDFKLVHSESLGIDAAVKNTIVGFKKVPAIEIVTGKDEGFWVVNATKKEERKYRAFSEVKDAIKQYVEKTKSLKLIEEEIGKLKTEYNVVVNNAPLAGEALPQGMLQDVDSDEDMSVFEDLDMSAAV